MKHIISYSGGVGSAITAEMVCDKYGKDSVTLLFADTNYESSELYHFNDKLKTYLGCDMVVISDGRDPWEVFIAENYMGNTRVDPCSKILKRELIRKYLNEHLDVDDTVVWIGIDSTEEHRLPGVVSRNKFTYRSILIENDIFLLPDMKEKWLKERNLPEQPMYKYGLQHNNCNGFCVKAGLGHFKLLYDSDPTRYRHHENREQKAYKANPKLRPFLRKAVNKEIKYITLKEYREDYLERDNSLTESDQQDHGGCGCAL